MGAHKPLMPFDGGTLIDAVIARAGSQVERLAIDVPPALAKDYAYENVLPDLFAEQLGPLCGVVTGLSWCEADWLATFSCDTPFLPRDLVAQLARHAHKAPVVARHGGRVHPICALWPKSALPGLRAEIARFRTMRTTLQAFGAVECEIAAPAHAFFNVNTKDDLDEALRLCGRED
jgi:molybdenum cofactor guanylyltransferase